MNQKSLFFAAAVIVLLAIAGVFWLMQEQQVAVNQPVVTDPAVETQISEMKQLSQTNCDMKSDSVEIPTNWKVYQNQSPSFSFQYPQNWNVNVNEIVDGELVISLNNPERKCYVEGTPAFCGVHVSLVRIKENESVNLKYLNFFEEISKTEAVEIKKVCVDGKEATEITDYQRHEIIFDRGGYSYKILSENLGSESDHKEFWDVVDRIGLGMHF